VYISSAVRCTAGVVLYSCIDREETDAARHPRTGERVDSIVSVSDVRCSDCGIMARELAAIYFIIFILADADMFFGDFSTVDNCDWPSCYMQWDYRRIDRSCRAQHR
jgi:hypothetical protein